MSRQAPAGAEPGASADAEFRRRRLRRWLRRLLSQVVALVGLAGAMIFVMRGSARGLAYAGASLLGAAIVAGLLVWADRDVERWQRGADGERATAALLARLPRRYRVSHDLAVPGSQRANIDHLVIGRTGVFVIDSKAYRARLRVRRGVVWAGDWPVDTGLAAWEADRVAGLLGVPVVPLVVVHGTGLRPASRLVRTLKRGRRRLRRAQVTALAEAAAAGLLPAGQVPPRGRFERRGRSEPDDLGEPIELRDPAPTAEAADPPEPVGSDGARAPIKAGRRAGRGGRGSVHQR
jgi:hypothetical protein